MIIGSYQRLNLIETDPPIYLGTERIKRVKTIKSLGLMLDETLSWNEQVNAITTKCGYDVRSCVLLQHLNLDNLETRRNQQLATLMFKVRNSMVPRSISKLFQRTDDVHNYETRQVQNYFPPKPNTNFKKKSFSYRGAVAWNSLPFDLKRSQTIQCFKNKL
jgi:hypothetical protein